MLSRKGPYLETPPSFLTIINTHFLLGNHVFIGKTFAQTICWSKKPTMISLKIKKSDVEIPDNKKHIPSFLEGTPSYVISEVWKAPCLPRELQSCMCGFCLQIFMCRLCCLLCRCDHQYIFFNITWERTLRNGQSLTHFSLESSTIYVQPQSVINTDWRWRKRLPKHFDQ